MKQTALSQRKPLLVALALSGAVAIAGSAFAQTSPGSPSTGATPPTATGGATKADTSGGMASKTPARTDTADQAWQKLGSKGFVSKDDVKSLSGFSFDTADANGDGRLTQDEFRRAWDTYASMPSSTGASPSASPSSSATPSSMAPSK
jgi:hypothetical protein